MSGINLDDIEKAIGSAVSTTGRNPDGFYDPKGPMPSREYSTLQNTNKSARGIEENELEIGGGDVDVSLDLQDFPPSENPKNQVRETESGHVTEMDDTPGRERILFKHRTGAGIDMRPDGDIIINTRRNMIRISAADEKVIIEGDGDIVYHGNLNMRVDGNYNLNVGGDYNVTVGGDHSEDIKGGYRQDINKNFQSLINRNVTQQITGNESRLVHGSYLQNIKGTYSTSINDSAEYLSSGIMRFTSQEELDYSSPSINMGTRSLLIAGDSGTVGGENIVYYGHTAHIPRVNSTSVHASNSVHASVGMEAPTFNGNLSGNASTAGTAGTAALGPAGGSAQATVSLTPATNKDTVQPNSTEITGLIHSGEIGIREISIDPGSILKNQINRTIDYNNVSERSLSTPEIRSKLRDPLNQQNLQFVSTCIVDNVLSASYSNATPDDIGRIISNESTPRRVGSKATFGKFVGAEIKRFKGTAPNITETLSVDPQYDPRLLNNIDSKTELQKGVRVAKFLGGYAHPTTFDHVNTLDERKLICKHLVPHANLMREIMFDNNQFIDYRLIVAEGVYRKDETETLTDNSINDLKSKGRAVVYELRNANGQIDLNKTFELATWWKDSVKFQKMILDYDTYNLNDQLNVQIIVIMPEFKDIDYTTTYDNEIETRFNNFVQSTDELIECLKN